MDHKALAEQYLADPWMNPDGSPVNWQRMLTHAILHLAGQIEVQTIVMVDDGDEEE